MLQNPLGATGARRCRVNQGLRFMGVHMELPGALGVSLVLGQTRYRIFGEVRCSLYSPSPMYLSMLGCLGLGEEGWG